MSTSKLIHSLPDVYRKDTDGNNFKILSLHGDAVDELRANMQAVLDAQDLQRAVGNTLDKYGAEVEQPRGSADDELYRVLIQQKMARDRGIGTWDSVSGGIRSILNCSDSDFYIHDSSVNRRVIFRVADSRIIENASLTKKQVKKIINQLLPATVKFAVIIPYPGSSTFAIRFVPVRLAIRSRVNAWMIDSARLNGVKKLNGAWVLNQEVRNHFLLSLLRVSSREIYSPAFAVNALCRSHSNARTFSVPGKLKVSTREKAALTMSPVKTAICVNQSIAIQDKVIRKTTNPVWTLNGTHLLNNARHLNAGQVIEEAI